MVFMFPNCASMVSHWVVSYRTSCIFRVCSDLPSNQLGVLTRDVDQIVQGIGYFAWGPVTLVGLSHDYRNLSSWLDAELDPARAEEFWATEEYCIDGNANVFTNSDTCQYFTRGCDGWADEIPQTAIREGAVMGLRSTPIAPWYLYTVCGPAQNLESEMRLTNS